MSKNNESSVIEYTKTILPGVEIKRCSNTHQSYKHHLHRELSLGYVISGKSTVSFGGKEYVYKKGDGVVIPPMLSHMCSPENPALWQIVMLYIDLSYYESGLDFAKASKVSGKELRALKEFTSLIENGADKTTLDLHLSTLLTDVAFATQVHNETAPENNSSISEIFSYLTANFKEDISLTTLEEKFGINKFTIIRAFKSKYNTTPLAFQLQLKLSEAKKMLDRGHSVMDAASELGFYDQPHFIREFKKMSGMTPNAYLKSISQ